jgi:hypothetical protein
MKKYLLSITIFTAFIGFVAYATVQTMAGGIEQPPKQNMAIVSNVKTQTDIVKLKKIDINNSVNKEIVTPTPPTLTPVIEPVVPPVIEPVIIPPIIEKQPEPVIIKPIQKTENENREKEREESDD